jgi:hypothetical protein
VGTVLSTYCSLWTDNLLAKPRSEKFFTLISKAGPNVVESAAILTEFVADYSYARAHQDLR